MENSAKKETPTPKNQETDFLFTKKIKCAVCRQEFDVKIVKNARIRRLQPDFDLRPRFQYIDTLKYDVYSCPHCGYAAISRSFDHLTKGQVQLVKDNICANFTEVSGQEPEIYDYKMAIARYAQALRCAKVKRAKTSEIAYTCLKISWMYRSLADEMPEGTESEVAKKAEIRRMQEDYYRQAYEGFQKALATEDFPICGMDTHTMDYLLACLACHFQEYSFASRSVSNILSSQTADRRIKDKALDLKQEIVMEIRKAAEQ